MCLYMDQRDWGQSPDSTIAFTSCKGVSHTAIHWFIIAKQVLQFHFTDGETEA